VSLVHVDAVVGLVKCLDYFNLSLVEDVEHSVFFNFVVDFVVLRRVEQILYDLQ